jgi:oligo-1,6-glucosidase
MLAPDDPVVYAFLRRLGEAQWLVAANFSADDAVLDGVERGDWTGAELVLGNYPDARPIFGGIELRPWEAVVVAVTG